MAVTPAGRPAAPNVTLPAKPPTRVTVIAPGAVPPCGTTTVAGLTATEKSGVCVTVTVSAIGVVRVSAPLVPVTVTVAAPVAAAAVAVKVSVLDAPVAVAGLNAALTPAGRPVAENVTPPVNPFRRVMPIVLVAVPACATPTVEGVAVSAKSGPAGAGSVPQTSAPLR